MSRFFKALEQAKRDRALREGPPPGSPPPSTARPATGAKPEIPPTPAPSAGFFRGVDERLVSLVTPAVFEAEQYRALRHIVEQLHKKAHLKVVAVSSPATGDGKTITAINLAGALAQSPEARVLLVDGDLRQPSLSRLLGIGGVRGRDLTSAILNPHLSLDDVLQTRPPFNLSVLSAGSPSRGQYEVLESPRLGELLDEARRQFDYVVIDTPPLVPVQDCRVIAHWVDGFLLVVAAHRTPRRLVEEALTCLERAKILGFVFNQDARSSGSRHQLAYYAPPGYEGEPSSNGHPGGTLRRAVRSLGVSLRSRGRPGRRRVSGS